MEHKCYEFLLSNFGNINMTGLNYLAQTVAVYRPDVDLKVIYGEVAEANGSTPAAVERAIRNYVATWSDKATAEELAIMFNYTLTPDQDKLYVREVIPLLRRYIDNME